MKHALLLLSLLLTFNGFAQSKSDSAQQPRESFVFNWPESEHWYEDPLFGHDENENVEWQEITRQPEHLGNWTELGSMKTAKGMVNVPLEVSMNKEFVWTKANSGNTKLTLIEKDEKAEFPWIVFTIEGTSSFKGDRKPESLLCFMIQGKTALYTTYWAVRAPSITEAQKKKWIAIFKNGKVVNM